MTNDDGTSCRPLVLLAIAIAAIMFVFPLFIRFPLLDPDEGLHASIAQEMVNAATGSRPASSAYPSATSRSSTSGFRPSRCGCSAPTRWPCDCRG